MLTRADAAEFVAPDITQYRTGNTGIDYVTSFDSGRAGPHVVLNALAHGNEICGAVALDHLFRIGLRPACGRLTLCFANVTAYDSFSPANPNATRFIDEDFNRLWDRATLEGPRHSIELARARMLRPIYASADLLLDIHSMQQPGAALMLTGLTAKSVAFARRVGVPETLVRDAGHAGGTRLLDFGAFGMEDAPAIALLVECGQHWQTGTSDVAIETSMRFLDAAGVLGPGDAARVPPRPVAPQRLISVTEAVIVTTDAFRFAADYRGLETIAQAGTLIARDGTREIRTPYDHCVLIMPSRRLVRGQTAVRLGRFEA